MVKPFYRSVLEDAGGFIVNIKVKLYFNSDTILPPFTSRITKLLLYSSSCFERIRKLYESKRSFRPVTLSTLHSVRGKPVFKIERDGDKPIRVRGGWVLATYITYYEREGSALSHLLYDCSGTLKEPFNSISYSIWELEVERLDDLSIGLDKDDVFGLEFKTPLVMSTKIMTPLSLRSNKLIRKTPNEYRLLPTPAYVASSAMRGWLGVVKGVNPDEYHAPYGIGRLADIFMPEMDYRLKPVTVVYGRDQYDRLRKIRGVMGYVVYTVRSKRLAATLDKLLALATRLGLGKNRSIGFGEVKVSILS